MKVAGAAAVGSAAFAGVASAHEVECVRFCGCGRMVAYGNLPDTHPVLVAKEGGGSGPADLNDYAVEGDENRNLEFTQRGRGKILALVIEDEDFGRQVWYNPNQCAQNVFDEHGGVEQTVEDHFDDNYEGYTAGQKGHCHPPRDDHDCNHDSGSDSNGESSSKVDRTAGVGEQRPVGRSTLSSCSSGERPVFQHVPGRPGNSRARSLAAVDWQMGGIRAEPLIASW